MLLIKTKVKSSTIHGLGVFSDEHIPKGTIIWKFTPGFDLKFTKEQILSFPKILQIYLYKYCWKGSKSKLYCLSSDNGKYFNHSINSNTISSYIDDEEEVITTTIKDIEVGEELTDNYSSFESDFDQDNILDEIAKKYQLEDELDPRLK